MPLLPADNHVTEVDGPAGVPLIETTVHEPGREAIPGTTPSPGRRDPDRDRRHADRNTLPSILADLSKARLSLLVLWTTFTGALLAVQEGSAASPFVFAWTMLGTALAAGSANAFNQIIEVGRDRLMHRTQKRPLVRGAMTRRAATAWATGMGIGGTAILYAGTTPLAAALAAATIGLYVLVYTPMKPMTASNTLVGAVVGALPPMLGYAAFTGHLNSPAPWLLAAILFVWQLPHFYALAWMYRDDYARGGFRMLPFGDDRGTRTATATLATSLLLAPITLAALIVGLGGWIYAAGAIMLGVWMTLRAVDFFLTRSDSDAKRVFLASLLYLPVLLTLLIVDPTRIS